MGVAHRVAKNGGFWERIQQRLSRKSLNRKKKRPALLLERLEDRLAMVNHAITDHIHPWLQIFLDGQQVTIPAGIGLDTAAGKEYSPHTHDTSGKLHVGEGLGAGIDAGNRYVTLKDFFDVWRTTNLSNSSINNPNAFFDSTHLMNKVADATHSVFMTVNGVTNTEYQNYIPEDGDQIILSYGASDGSPVLQAIPNSTLLVGSPLWVPLDGLDPQGQAITYTVTSSNPNVTATVANGDPSWKITVDGFGSMTFMLFQDKVPRPVNRVVTLTNQGFYNGLTFHRVINNFVIQGGDPSGDGTGGSSLGNFDDQFDVDLQHNRTGLLSFAKSTDDTNNSQFFITEGAQRHLDFNHSIFGVLTEGEAVRDAISNVATNSSTGKPNTTVTIEKAQIFNDTQNGAVLLKAAAGATGTSTITVTARDADGHTAVRTFTVTLANDTANGGPFLNDIPAIRTTVNTPAVFTVTSQDPEGNAVTYSATKGDSLNSTVTANATSGQITATPPAGFVGTMLVKVSVAAATGVTNDTADKADAEAVAVTVAPSAPTSVDLVTANDSGVSSTDNITNVTSPSFLVSGVTNGALVKLYNGSTVVGQATASGTTVTITVSGLTQGSYSLKATQTVSSIESDPSSALAMVIDTTSPTISSTAPTSAKVGLALQYDVQSSEEGNTGLVYSLVNAPTGATIDASTGVISWTPTTAQLGAQTFGVSVTDAAGNIASQNINVTVAAADQTAIRLALTDSNGNAITSVPLNGTFQLRGFVQDIRATAKGVFAAYYDVTFPTSSVSVNGAIDHGSTYTAATAGDTDAQGLNEVGGTQNGTNQLGGGEQLLFVVPMKANAVGNVTFAAGLPDTLPLHAVLLHGLSAAVPTDQLRLGSVTLTVQSPLTAGNDTFNVDEDAAQTTLNVLANDTLPNGSTATLHVTQVGTANHGGTVSVPSNGLGVLYKPAANFNGDETFTYTVSDGTLSQTATVTVSVHPVNDAPTAANDALSVNANSVNNILDVLVNDSFAPDTGETLKVSAIGSTTHAIVTIGPNGTHLVYTPNSGFTGTDTFTYTISDGNGGTATATATVTVSNSTDPPTAGNDAITVNEDSSNNTVNVLVNDTPGTTAGETVKVSAVGTPNKGGIVTIGTSGANVIYTPAANFNGSETFTYTVTDGAGGFATATVTATVTSINDAPTAGNDSATISKNSTAQTIAVLTNDSFSPDTGETLTIQSVTQGQHGTVAIATDKKSLLFTPTTDYTGSDTFTYTVTDGNGGTATATVTVNVVAFVPSSVSGKVFLDINNDGLKQDREVPLTGVTVNLVSTDAGNSTTATTTTDGEGNYLFPNLPPGNYKVTQTQPALLVDGKVTPGVQGGTASTNAIQFNLAENTAAANNNFAELRSQAMVTIRSFLARNHNDFLYAIIDTATSKTVSVPGEGWADFTSIQTSLVNSPQALKLDVVPLTGSAESTSIVTSDPRVKLVSQSGSQLMYRINASPEALNFQPASSSSLLAINPGDAVLTGDDTTSDTTSDSSASSRLSSSASDSGASDTPASDTPTDGSEDSSKSDTSGDTTGDSSSDSTSGDTTSGDSSSTDSPEGEAAALSAFTSASDAWSSSIVSSNNGSSTSTSTLVTPQTSPARMSSWLARPRATFDSYAAAVDQLFADL